MKRFLSFLLCLLLLLTPTAAFAADEGAMQIFSCRMNEQTNMLELLLYAKTGAYISAGDFIVRADDSELRTDRLSGLGSDGTGTSWVVVLEPAVWDSIAKMGATLIDSLAVSLGENDNLAMVDARTGEVLSFTRDATAIRRFADSALRVLSYGNGANKLNDAIHNALSLLGDGASDSVRDHKALLVISEGIEKDSIYSLEQNCEDVERLAVTAYIIGIARDSNYADNFVKLSALAQRSPSGFATSFSEYKSETGQNAAKLIRDNEKYCYLLSVDPGAAELQNPSDVRITVELNGRQVSREHVELNVVPATPHEHVYENPTCQQPAVCSCGEVDPSGATVDHSYGEDGRCIWCGEPKFPLLAWVKDNLLLCIMGAVLLLLLIVLLIVLIVRKRHRGGDDDDMDEGRTAAVTGGGRTTAVSGYPGSTYPVSGKVTVELTNKATGQTFTGVINDSTLKAGRTSELSLTGDGAISREHMEFVWQNGILYVQDANATNGTLVNGIQIHGAIPLHQNDVIHAGESDFYVTWRSSR